MVLTSFTLFAKWYCQFILNTLQVPLLHDMDKFKAIDEKTIGYFNVARYAPNVIGSLIAGAGIDKYGLRKTILVLEGLNLIGQLIFWVGSDHDSLFFLLVGQVIKGSASVPLTFA